MTIKKAPLAAVAAGLSVGALAVGFAVTSRDVPALAGSGDPANPIGGAAPATTPTPAPSKPVTTPSAPPSTPVRPGPVKVKLDLTKLRRGADPKVPFVDFRTVVSGNLRINLPGGDGPVRDVAKAGDGLLIVTQVTDTLMGMQLYDGAGKRVTVIRDVRHVESSLDASTSAYATGKTGANGEELKGYVVWLRDNQTGKTVSLPRPDDYNLQVLGVDARTVYFEARAAEATSKWNLYRWDSASKAATLVKTVPMPTAVSVDGTRAASLLSLGDGGSCSAVVAVETGTRQWKTCAYQIDGFGQDGRTVLAGPAYRDGYGDGLVAVLDDNGRLIREWDGLFLQSAMEDTEHVLMLAEQDGKSALVRCAATTNPCELASPITKTTADSEQGNRYRLGDDA